MTGRSAHELIDDTQRALCWGADTTGHEVIMHALITELGAVLEDTVRSKTLCLLAAYLHHHPIPELDRSVTRFLDSTLRTNRYKTSARRAAALADTAALRAAGVPAVVLGGLSVEHTLYASTGARQFSDIDVLIAPHDIDRAHAVLHNQGYEHDRRRGTWIRETGDPIIPLIVYDLAPTLPLSGTENTVADLLARRTGTSAPPRDTQLPVLALSDAATYTLARLAARPRWVLAADAIRQCRASTPSIPHHADVLAGWAVLRSRWPSLPAAPSRLRAHRESNR